MRRVLIDTNVYVAFKRADSRITELFRHLDTICLDTTVIAELYAGFKGGDREKRNRSELEAFCNTPRVKYINHTRQTAEFYAQIFHILKQKGMPLPTNDIWIAAAAMENGLALLSLDRHFSRIEGLILKELE
ncbi:type II toxin-antitoxin system VapC family toxin [bacterium]|nr:type II toxin-antitoxin system VapC family toxin [bacterium]